MKIKKKISLTYFIFSFASLILVNIIWLFLVLSESESDKSLLAKQFIGFALIIILGGVIIFLLSRSLGQYLMRRLERLDSGAKIINSGNYPLIIPIVIILTHIIIIIILLCSLPKNARMPRT